MAVIKTIVTDRNVIFSDQYCRVESATAVDKSNLRYTIGIYMNKEVVTEPPHRAEIFETTFDLYSKSNLWQQAYADIKNRWPDATDD